MNGHANGSITSDNNFDVVIVGAGISGINAAYRVQTNLPDLSYTILEGRAELGGTWSLFKYPGIRSDSDLHTFGFPFNPWTKPNPIASGASIVEYLRGTVEKYGIDRKIQYEHKVASADWSSDAQRWRLEVDHEGHRRVYYAKFIVMGTGYYDYEKPLEADIPGLESFQGTRVHPQFWPEDLEYAGKRMVVIGSGATAITLLPALVDGGVGQVTMLQRSPSYVLNMPQPKPGQMTWYERVFPQWLSLRLKRLQFILVPYLLYLFCRKFPTAAANFIRKEAKAALPKDFPLDPHFKPAYKPWDQRLCLCPDQDFFKCFETGRAQIVTSTIKRVVSDGIELETGEKLEVDIIVTATGLNLQFCGAIQLSVDQKPVSLPDCFIWRATMLSGVPNLFLIIGYANASWTLGADCASRLLTRLISFMNQHRYTSATPKPLEQDVRNPVCPLALNSTYVKKAESKMPHAGCKGPWRPRDNYIKDRWAADRADLRQGLEFGSVSS